MSIINKAPEMVKREYELQEPIAVAVEKYATFIQSTPDHIGPEALESVEIPALSQNRITASPVSQANSRPSWR
ncbi:MAG TPA: hypothetical protein VKH63_15535 [Candidatus Acidoferrum sp.]|jgi:hypothetical protein|nr:hypothetical protein [Candidatus Acidoferrum sp.]